MADGDLTGPVKVTDADSNASAADFLPLDDSDTSGAQVSHNDDQASHAASDDSDSDVSMETEDEDNANLSTPPPQASRVDASTSAPNDTFDVSGEAVSRKRKSLNDAPDSHDAPNTLEPVKKVKLDKAKGALQGEDEPLADRSHLPAELWSHIFTFCPPKTLGKLLLVNRLFNMYLDPSSVIQCRRPEPLSEGILAILKPNSIWQASRRRFWPGMPVPLKGMSELFMWQLCCSTSCQHCGVKSSAPQQNGAADPWQSGPGKDGVAIIWAFATRSCGACLLSKSTKVCPARK